MSFEISKGSLSSASQDHLSYHKVLLQPIRDPEVERMSIKENNRSFIGVMNPCNVSLKTWILIAICLQNAGYSLIRKYSVKYENVSSKEILIVSEIIKLVVSIWMTLNDKEKTDAQGTGINKLIWLVVNSSKMLVLAGIYGAMNILSFVALQYIGAGEFTICAQLKILSTAGFSVLILGTSLSATKWRALALLVFGCILVASPSFDNNLSNSKEVDALLQLFGFGAVLTEVVLSGFASIYFERVVKSTTEVVSIWERNFQLGLYSILIYGGIILYENVMVANSSSSNVNNSTTLAPGFGANWTWVTLMVSLLGAVGGLLVAATLKYADSILKTLAAAGAIVLSTLLGHYLLAGPLNLVVSLGGAVTILAIANYTLDATVS
mmetsp:Transcript_12016/g.17989  ORF Transcript_12016/g.17989 Transcript_12016/m.17989 type:complete len:380 (+) Transcript_12016:18-1157(+)